MIRVLHVFHEMVNGGTGHFVMNYYRHIDRSKVQFDFLASVSEPGYWDEEIRSLGGRIFHAYPFNKNPIKNYYDIARIVRENQYRIVHRHTGSAFGYFDLRAARHGGAEQLILHAHSTDVGKPFIHQATQLFLKIPCHRFACSQEAGRFLFGESVHFTVIPNAIDVQRFSFQPMIREKIRKEFGLENLLVIGHVGRFQPVKNHSRLLSIFAEIHKQRPDSALVCVGDGEKMGDTKALAKQLGLEDAVLFLGQRNDVQDLLSAFDAFLLPSLYEGLGIVLVEAQCNGLKCFASKDVIPNAVNLTGNIAFISLSASDQEWAAALLQSDLTRDPMAMERVKDAGYDISDAVGWLTRKYLEMANSPL